MAWIDDRNLFAVGQVAEVRLGYVDDLASLIKGEERTIIGVVGDDRPIDRSQFETLDGVEKTMPVLKPFKLASRDMHPMDSHVSLNHVPVGGPKIAVMAGPCSVESREQIIEVAHMVNGVTKLDKVQYGELAAAETVRKMIVAMAGDIRVLVIKLADRLHNARTFGSVSLDSASRKATETLDIFAPLAHRLGMNTVKWELEDIAFRTLYPKVFEEIRRQVSERAGERAEYLHTVQSQVEADLAEARARLGDGASLDDLCRTDKQRRMDALAVIFDDAVSARGERTGQQVITNLVIDHETLDRYAKTFTGEPLDPDPRLESWWQDLAAKHGTRDDDTDAGKNESEVDGDVEAWAGCNAPASTCQADHLLPWAHPDKGRTDPGNGAPTCGKHNRFRNHGFTVHRDDDGTLHVHRPDGTRIE